MKATQTPRPALSEQYHMLVAYAIRAGKLILNQYRQFPKAYAMLGYLFLTMAFCYSPIVGHWLTGFVMMTLPVAIIAGFITCLYLWRKGQHIIATAGLIWVLCSLPVVKRLIGGLGTPAQELTSAKKLNVLSFNSESFGDDHTSAATLKALKADIACFQEYTPNRRIEQQYADQMAKLTCFDNNREVGLALFSQYPIINQYGRIWNRAGGPNINGYLCADIVYGRDTVRVVNVHLWSMGVRVNTVFEALSDGKMMAAAEALYDTFDRLREGFEKRDEQIQEVEAFVAGSRYPVIICGDFNETPFSYSYGQLSKRFSNAFEVAGKGMGFTLNRHPYCVRIDQQFFSADWYVTSCQTISDITVSDHFPVMAQYVLKKSVTHPSAYVASR
ncbi:endonuclease/exonuclease/phosphatase family protein [Arsenicibacter rosenii]|uniref:Endonuclease/exonuclease/phosphatase n=1 Tax=Arsenicibacter rosenii TaxID=1750698 RepID=A0A1S2VII8_9BACT|nr:endonuclease/exonuclease/phosphatase family protein [Arsenicibacter rosenii]OIN58577.1 endonuclease/exonuclease/phosphatase [Arsenicibacter rosenii]